MPFMWAPIDAMTALRVWIASPGSRALAGVDRIAPDRIAPASTMPAIARFVWDCFAIVSSMVGPAAPNGR